MTGTRFCVSLPVEVEEGVEVNVTVRGVITPRIPATQYEPEEGGEIEDLEIGNERGCPLPGEVVKRLEADENFLDRVIRLAEEGSEPDYDAINKANKEDAL